MMPARPLLTTKPAHDQSDVQHFFDSFAAYNTEQHGAADRLLAYRMNLLHQFGAFRPGDVVLDIGCGDGKHLFALDGAIGRGIGVDFAPNMIASARNHTNGSHASRFSFSVDDAQSLATVGSASVDVVICTGALEHMLDKRAVLSAVRRVLRDGGRFVCLTLNNQFIWYSKWAPALRHPTYHLATDKRLDAREARGLLSAAGFTSSGVDYWTFIPRGDMPAWIASTCSVLDKLGHLGARNWLRSGLILHAVK